MSPDSPRAPSLARRAACMVYEALILAALLLVATFPYLAVAGDSTAGLRRHLLQGWVLGVAGAYFIAFWARGGQTVPMKTWRIRLEREEGGRVGLVRAAARYVLALLGLATLGAGYFWAFLDRDGQFLHDRLAGTRLVDARLPPAGDGAA